MNKIPPKMQKMMEGPKDAEKKPKKGAPPREGSKKEVALDFAQLVKKKGH